MLQECPKENGTACTLSYSNYPSGRRDLKAE
jgi:hypothetical protein